MGWDGKSDGRSWFRRSCIPTVVTACSVPPRPSQYIPHALSSSPSSSARRPKVDNNIVLTPASSSTLLMAIKESPVSYTRRRRSLAAATHLRTPSCSTPGQPQLHLSHTHQPRLIHTLDLFLSFPLSSFLLILPVLTNPQDELTAGRLRPLSHQLITLTTISSFLIP
jgi:hypothetical protein